MEDEQLFQTGDGSIFNKAEAAEIFGGEQALMELVDDGEVSLYEGDAVPTSQQDNIQEKEFYLDESAVYITGDGSVLDATQVTEIFGSAKAVQELIEDGEIKKKDQYGVGSLPGETTDSLLEPKLIEDTLLESSPQLLTQNNQIINNIVIDGTPLSQMSEEDQQLFYKELQGLKFMEDRKFELRESPMGSGTANDVLKTQELLYNASTQKLSDKDKKIRLAAQDFRNRTDSFNKMTGFLLNQDGERVEQVDNNYIDPAAREVVNNYFGAKKERTISFNEEGELVSAENKSAVPSWVTAVEPEAQSTGGPEKFLGFIPNPFHYSKEEVEEINQQRKIDENILDKYSINNDDFKVWLDKNGKSYSFFEYETLDFLEYDEGRDKLVEKLHYQQLMGYTATVGNQITSDLNIVKNTLQFETDPAVRRKLLNEQAQLEQALIVNVAKRNTLLKEFPQLMEEQEAQRARTEEYIEAVRDGSISEPVFQVLKKSANAGDKFLMDIGGFFPEVGEQILDGVGVGDSGFGQFLGIFNETWQRTTEDYKPFDVVDTRAVEGMKEVTIQWNGAPLTVGLTESGNIVDAASGASMAGLLDASQIKEITEKADLIPQFEDNWNLEGSISGTTSTIVNLFGLIRGGKAVTKQINKGIAKTGSNAKVGGGVGMGLTSYAT